MDSGRVFQALFAHFLSCLLSWSSSIRLSSVMSLSFCTFRCFSAEFSYVFLCYFGDFPVLFRFRGSSSVASWSSCLVFCFFPVLVISALYFVLRVCLASGISFSIGALVSCDAMRMSFAFFCLSFSLLLLLVGTSVVSLLLSYSVMFSFCYCCFFRVSFPSPSLSVSFGSVPLFRGGLVFFSWDLERLFIALRPLSLAWSSLLYLCEVLVSVVFLPRWSLRFPSRRGLPLGRVMVY